MKPLQTTQPVSTAEFPTVNILCSKLDHKLGDNRFSELLDELPEDLQHRIESINSLDSAQASLVSKLLLKKGFQKYHHLDRSALDKIGYTRYDRPVYADDSIDFNISHSYELVTCAISPGIQIGIDLEKIRPVNVGHFLKEFSGQELMNIHNAVDQCTEFFSYWTKKEAILKAEGLGLNQSLSEITFNQKGNEADIFSHHWFLYQIPVDHGYCCWLASSEELSEGSVRVEYQHIE